MGRSLKDEEDLETHSHTQTHTQSSNYQSASNSIYRDTEPPIDPTSRHRHEVPIAVVEQRASNLAQGSLCLVLLTGPFLHLLHLIPRGVLAGLLWVDISEAWPNISDTILRSWYMGADALRGNGITKKILYLIQDKSLTSRDEPLHNVRKSRIVLFVGIQLVAFGATFAITQTIGEKIPGQCGLILSDSHPLSSRHRVSSHHHASYSPTDFSYSQTSIHKWRTFNSRWTYCFAICMFTCPIVLTQLIFHVHLSDYGVGWWNTLNWIGLATVGRIRSWLEWSSSIHLPRCPVIRWPLFFAIIVLHRWRLFCHRS